MPGQQRAPLEQLLLAVSKLPLLTELRLGMTEQQGDQVLPPTALTALVASTDLRALELRLPQREVPEDWVMFSPSTVYPHLRSINLASMDYALLLLVNGQQLQHLCSCCPAVESLEIALRPGLPPASCLPLLQLSALTRLRMASSDGTAAAAGAAAVDVVAQLTRLKQLRLQRIPRLPDPSLLQLTALTALEDLELSDVVEGAGHGRWFLRNKVGGARQSWPGGFSSAWPDRIAQHLAMFPNTLQLCQRHRATAAVASTRPQLCVG
jgi:hypothetical protein